MSVSKSPKKIIFTRIINKNKKLPPNATVSFAIFLLLALANWGRPQLVEKCSFLPLKRQNLVVFQFILEGKQGPALFPFHRKPKIPLGSAFLMAKISIYSTNWGDPNYCEHVSTMTNVDVAPNPIFIGLIQYGETALDSDQLISLYSAPFEL